MCALSIAQWLIGYFADAPFTPTLASVVCYLSTFVVGSPDDSILKKKRSKAATWYLKGLAAGTAGFLIGALIWWVMWWKSVPQMLQVL